MKDITILIPVHKFDETVEQYLLKAFKSVVPVGEVSPKTFIVCTKEIKKDIKKVDKFKDYKNWIEVDGDTDFCSMINKAVDKCNTEYFSILEFDDMFTSNAFKSIVPYIENSEAKTGIYLTIQELYDVSGNEPEAVGYINEAAWASAFSEEIGYLDIESLEAYYNFNLTGAIIDTEMFKRIGGLKPSIKISFWYEFLLRAIYNENMVYVIPKVCYKHIVNRPDSLTSEYVSSITQEEGAQWIELAQEEYFFKEDRKKKPNFIK